VRVILWTWFAITILDGIVAFLRKGTSLNWCDVQGFLNRIPGNPWEWLLGICCITLLALLGAMFHATKNIVQDRINRHAAAEHALRNTHIAQLTEQKTVLETAHGTLLASEQSAHQLTREQLNREQRNLDGCPRILLGYKAKTKYGFFVAASGADGVQVEIEAVKSPHYVLTSTCVPHVVNGVPEYPFELRADLISDEPGYAKDARGEYAWQTFAKDTWYGLHPLDTSKDEGQMLAAYVIAAVDQELAIPLRITYRDLCGKCYASVLDLVWTPLLSSVEIRPKTIERVPC
jgi:hypothetical protein